MLNLPQNPTTLQAASEDFGEMGSQRISVVSDQANGFGCSNGKTDSFLVDIEGFGYSVDKDLNANSRITRNWSRKGSSLSTGEKRTCSSPTSNDSDGSLLSVATSSSKASTVDTNMDHEVTFGVGKHPANSPIHHQITITTGNVGTNKTESKWNNRRSNSFRRPPLSWISDPRKILLFFATLSSMGTVVLIFLTLSMRAGLKDGALE